MELKEWANIVVEEAQRNVGAIRIIDGKRRRTDTTGKLRKGLSFSLDETNGKTIISFNSDQPYADFVHDGVRGAISSPISTKDSEYKYSSKQPPIDPIIEWIKRKRIRVRSSDGKIRPNLKTVVDRRTGRTKKVDQRQSLAFAISKNIRKHGIPGNPFFKDAVDTHRDKIAEVDFKLLR